jgi:hypothetical protein
MLGVRSERNLWRRTVVAGSDGRGVRWLRRRRAMPGKEATAHASRGPREQVKMENRPRMRASRRARRSGGNGGWRLGVVRGWR